jgi:hypothetical protein
MAPLFAAVSAMSLLLSQRIASQKQALWQLLSDCRKFVDGAQHGLQTNGRIQSSQIEDVRMALAMLWETGFADTMVCTLCLETGLFLFAFARELRE